MARTKLSDETTPKPVDNRRAVGVKVDPALYAFLEEARWANRAGSISALVLLAVEDWAVGKGFARVEDSGGVATDASA